MPVLSRPPRPTRARVATSLVLAAAGVLGLLSAGCAPGSVTAGSVAPAAGTPVTTAQAEPSSPVPPAPAGATPVAGRIGEFVAQCPFSHRSTADPLVFPHGEPGHAAHIGHDASAPPLAHSHDFFGNTTTDEHTTTASLLASRSTTCDLIADLSSYWAPTMFRGDEVIPVDEFVAYYDTAPDVDPALAQPIPDGLNMIAGNDPRPDAPPVHAAGWTCGKARTIEADVPTCLLGAPLTLRVTFPDCWNGTQLQSDDHRSHVAYSEDGACPATHPVPIVRLVLRARYPIYGDPAVLTLSSGPLTTAHADFMNAWTTEGMQEHVDLCIRRRVVCGVA